MQIHQLRYFVAVAEELHFGRAAQRENVSQPPLSLQVRKLEEELGVELFHRTKRKVQLTEAGAAFLPEARGILEATGRAREVARRAQRGEVGQVRIGFVHSASLGYLPRLVGPFRSRHPGIEIRLEEMTVSEQTAALQKGRIDVGVLRPPSEDPTLSAFNVTREPFNLVVWAEHPLAARQAVDLAELADEDFVFYPEHRSPAFYRQLTEMCLDSGFLPKVAVEANTMYTAIGLVGTGAGIAIVPESVACVQNANVRYLRFINQRRRAELDLVYHARRASRSTWRLVEFAKQMAEGRLDPGPPPPAG